MSWFRRGSPTALERLKGASWRCAQCGDVHRGMFDLAMPSPDAWDGPMACQPNGALTLDGDFLSEDFCVLDGAHYFVRGVFPIPVHGLDEDFGFGIWSTLSRANFGIYVDAFDDGDYADPGPWTGWFSTGLKPFADTLNQGCLVHPRPGRQRPHVSLMDQDHELAQAQIRGISPERVMDIYAAHGHAPR